MLYTSKDDFDITNIPSYDIDIDTDIDTDIKGYIISWGSIAPDIIHTKPTFIDRSYSIYITLYNKYEIPPVFGAVSCLISHPPIRTEHQQTTNRTTST